MQLLRKYPVLFEQLELVGLYNLASEAGGHLGRPYDAVSAAAHAIEVCRKHKHLRGTDPGT